MFLKEMAVINIVAVTVVIGVTIIFISPMNSRGLVCAAMRSSRDLALNFISPSNRARRWVGLYWRGSPTTYTKYEQFSILCNRHNPCRKGITNKITGQSSSTRCLRL